MGKKITAQAIGGEATTFDEAKTVREVKELMGLESYVATVNGNPASDDTQLADYAFVSLTVASKGGC